MGHLNCSRVMANDGTHISEMVAKGRIRFEDPAELDMDCWKGIRHRNYFPEKGAQMVLEEDADFTLAQARIVYKVSWKFLKTQ